MTEAPPALHHSTFVAGVKFRDGARERLKEIPEGAELQLERDPTNQHDRNAVKILHAGFHLGFVPRDLAAEVSAMIQDGRAGACIKRKGNSIRIYFKE